MRAFAARQRESYNRRMSNTWKERRQWHILLWHSERHGSSPPKKLVSAMVCSACVHFDWECFCFSYCNTETIAGETSVPSDPAYCFT